LSTSESFNPEIRLAELMRRNREAYLSYLQALKPSSM
jgi:hypothetical protein